MTTQIHCLGDVLIGIEAGKSIQSLEREARPDEPGVLKVSAVSWGRFDAAAAKAVSDDYQPPAFHRIRQGDLIFSRANTIELTGAVAIAERDYPNRYLSDKLLRLIVNTEKVMPDYLMFALRSPKARDHIERYAGGTSDSMRNIAQSAMLRTPIQLPSLDRQRAVANQLMDSFRDAALSSKVCSEQVALAELLQTRILEEDFSSPPISTKAATNDIRSGWLWRRLTNVTRLESGHTPSRRYPEWWGGDVPWLALPDIRKLHGKYAYETAERTNDAGLANSSARLLPTGTVCFSRTASVGFVTILGKPMATSQDFCNWVCGPELDPEFLMYAFMASQQSLRELASGAVHKTIYMPTLQSFQVCAPAIGEQRRIASVLRERLKFAEALCDGLKARLDEIERLPSRLLAAAFGTSG